MGSRRLPVPGTLAPALALAVLTLAGAPGSARAQDEGRLETQCAALASASARNLCNETAQAVEIAHPRVGLAFSAGNPVAGTASTLGMRLGSTPRIGVGLRATAVYLEIPPIDRSGGSLKLAVPAVSGDVAVGLFNGITLAPTVGGLGSVDVLGSLGVVPVSGGKFESSPLGWGIGARLGLLRESFFTPGVSVSGMYRGVGEIRYGDQVAGTDSASFRVSGYRDLSVRAAVSKRLFVLGLAAGAGWDRYSSDMAVRVRDMIFGCPACAAEFSVDDYTSDRWSAFADVSWTALVFSLVGEVGWQKGGKVAPLATPTGYEDLVRKGTFFGSLAFRLTI